MGLHRVQRRVASAISKYTDRYIRSETWRNRAAAAGDGCSGH
jgi:hypothetical protein